MQGGQQSSATDQSLETAQQDAWQLFQQGGTPMRVAGATSKRDVPQIDYGYDNATSAGAASVMLSHDLNGAGKDLTSQKDDDKQMNH